MGKGITPRDGEIIVDERGRTSLQRVRKQVYDRYLACEHEDGTIVLTPVILVSPAAMVAVAEARRDPDVTLEHLRDVARQVTESGPIR